MDKRNLGNKDGHPPKWMITEAHVQSKYRLGRGTQYMVMVPVSGPGNQPLWPEGTRLKVTLELVEE